jgi:hypothetical protein
VDEAGDELLMEEGLFMQFSELGRAAFSVRLGWRLLNETSKPGVIYSGGGNNKNRSDSGTTRRAMVKYSCGLHRDRVSVLLAGSKRNSNPPQKQTNKQTNKQTKTGAGASLMESTNVAGSGEGTLPDGRLW